jgi:hypothetical protein
VKRYVESAGELGKSVPPRRRARVTDDYRELIAAKGCADARSDQRRLLRLVRAAGYDGPERSLRRAVVKEKRAFRGAGRARGGCFGRGGRGLGSARVRLGSAGTVETPAGRGRCRSSVRCWAIRVTAS